MSMFNKSMMMSAVLVAGSLFAFAGKASAADHHVTIDNKTDTTLVSFYVARPNDQYWSDDYLGDGRIDSGYHLRLNIDDGSGACTYDFKAVFDDGTSLIRRNVNVCRVGTFTYDQD